jgi:hypothetical protein
MGEGPGTDSRSRIEEFWASTGIWNQESAFCYEIRKKYGSDPEPSGLQTNDSIMPDTLVFMAIRLAEASGGANPPATGLLAARRF